jgi:hypothetical protein
VNDLSVLMPLAAAAIGAAGGYFANARLQNARPRMAVLGCTLSADLARSDEPARPDPALLLAFETTPEIGADWLDRYEDISEVDYVIYLQSSKLELDLQVSRQPTFEQVVEKLRTHLRDDRHDAFRALWADEHAILWSPLITAFSRGDISDLPERMPRDDDSTTKIRVREDFVVLIYKDRFMYFSFDSEDDTQQAFSKHAALAIAECIREDLKVLLDELEKYGQDRRLADLNARVTSELEKFNRVQVNGHFSNTGRQPCSVPNTAKLFLKTNGAPRKAATESGRPGAISTYDADVEIDLIIVDASGEEYDFEAPIEIPAGGLVPFAAASALALPDYNFGADLEAKLDGGGLKAQIGFVVSRPGTNALDTLYSDEFDFIEYSQRIKIEARQPPRRERWRNKFSIKKGKNAH